MKPTLVLKMGQQLTMTPQLQQAIKLLQLSTLDLQQEIQEALESNPMLELAEDSQVQSSEQDAEPTSERDHDHEELKATDDWDEHIPSDLPVDSGWDDVYPTASPSGASLGGDDEFSDFAQRTSAEETLQDHLLWQLNLIPTSDTDLLIGTALIDAISPAGYLNQSLEEIHQGLDPSLEIELEEVEMMLHRIQQFDPVGIGARDLRECLQLQLRQLPDSTPRKADALNLVERYLELLGNRDYAGVMRKTKLDEAALKEVLQLIQSLNPHPGNEIESDTTEYVVPDILVRKVKGQWRAELNGEAIPRLRVNTDYAALVRRADSSSDNTYLKNHLQEARWFLKSLQSRNETLLRVASCIVEQQRGFFDYGEEAMKPMVLHDIAEAVEMHESTISRVTTQKYMHTPRGIFELKFFFSSHVSTASGGECSSTAIRAIIKKLIAAEIPKKPLSDSKIATMLAEQGIKVARRTVAKYRESMGIAASSERKRLV